MSPAESETRGEDPRGGAIPNPNLQPEKSQPAHRPGSLLSEARFLSGSLDGS